MVTIRCHMVTAMPWVDKLLDVGEKILADVPVDQEEAIEEDSQENKDTRNEEMECHLQDEGETTQEDDAKQEVVLEERKRPIWLVDH